MKKKEKQQFTATIADVSSIRFEIRPEEEEIYRKASYYVNNLWNKYREKEPNGDSRVALAKVALAFAELYVRKETQLKEHDMLLDKFESELDDILLNNK
jgi:predicted S18 family serine protease